MTVQQHKYKVPDEVYFILERALGEVKSEVLYTDVHQAADVVRCTVESLISHLLATAVLKQRIRVEVVVDGDTVRLVIPEFQ